jgi:hypothetical protein
MKNFEKIKLFFCCVLFVLMAMTPNISASREELAGEAESGETSQVRKIIVDEEEGPRTLTRSASSSAPSFKLPEYVIVGSGEQKTVYQRPQLNFQVDTSGGIKTSPGEHQASKNQLSLQERQELSPGDFFDSRPFYGRLLLAYGWRNTFTSEAFWGQQLDSFFYLFKFARTFSDGGPLPLGTFGLHQFGQDQLYTQAGWQFNPEQKLTVEAGGYWRHALMPASEISVPRVKRSLAHILVAWDGIAPGYFQESILDLSYKNYQIILPFSGTAYVQNDLKIGFDFQKEFFSRHNSNWLQGQAVLTNVNQKDLIAEINSSRELFLLEAALGTRLVPWQGARLNLNLGLDWLSGARPSGSTTSPDDMLLSVRAAWDQRLHSKIDFFARFWPKLIPPWLDNSMFNQDPVILNTNIYPVKELVDLSAGFRVRSWSGFLFETAVFYKLREDHFMLNEIIVPGLWSQAQVKRLRTYGFNFKQEWSWSWGLEQFSRYIWQDYFKEQDFLTNTFFPENTFETGVNFKDINWYLETSVRVVSGQKTSLDGSGDLNSFVDWGAQIQYKGFKNWVLFLRLNNLLAQTIADFPLYTYAAPHAQAGWIYKF